MQHTLKPTLKLSARSAAFSLLLLGTFCASSWADVQYTTVMSMIQDGQPKPLSTTTTFLKKGLMREDTEQTIGTFKRSETNISNAARHEQISLDPALKIYTVQTIGAGGAVVPQSEVLPTGTTKPTTRGKGKMVMTLGAQFVGNEKLIGYETRHYKTTMDTDSSGCCGTGETKMKSETWMADIELPVFDPGTDGKSQNYQPYVANSNCDITFERKGDVAGFDKANKGLALKRIFFDDKGNPTSQMQITMLSLAALGDDRFAAPADFKKVSLDAYNKARQDALMASMTQMTTHAQQEEADDDTNTEATANTTDDDAPANGGGQETAKEVAKETGKQKARKKLHLPF